ncbi:MAG: T9SS type A sorting domain-containing protein [Bacteroidota bacterium]|nr:T9SS type A sorting domain-containing protein [Bacteroidota bacterium]
MIKALRSCLAFTGLFLLSVAANAQASSFAISPAKTVVADVMAGTNTDMHILIKNTTADALVFDWRVVELTIDTSADNHFVSYCDNVTCYFKIPSFATSAEVAPGDSMDMKFSIAPPTDVVSTSGRFAVYINVQGDPENGDTITYEVRSWATGIDENGSRIMALYPNPASDVLNINFSDPVSGVVQVQDIAGRTLAGYSLNNLENLQVPVSALPVGMYLITLREANGRVSVMKFSRL